jgi:hypothetical protein
MASPLLRIDHVPVQVSAAATPDSAWRLEEGSWNKEMVYECSAIRELFSDDDYRPRNRNSTDAYLISEELEDLDYNIRRLKYR